MAAATAELVATLSLRRRSVAPRRAELERIRDGLRDLQRRFLAAADRDVAVLAELLAAQRAARPDSAGGADGATARRRALIAATETPLALARDGLELLRLVRAALPFAARFTVSDLGAAAALAQGAIEAALLMSEVNLALLAAEPEAGPLADAVAAVRQKAAALAGESLRHTRGKLAGRPQEGEPGGHRA